MTDFSFSLFNLDTQAYIGELVDYTSVSAGFEYSAASAFTCDYPTNGRFFGLIDTDVEVVCYFRGVEPRNGRWIVRGLDGETVSNTGGGVKLSGLSLLDLLRKVVVYTSTTFSAQTFGAIIKTLLATATTRGAFGATAITTTSFTNTTDSNGNAWAKTLTITYGPGATYRQIIEQAVERGIIDFEFNGRDLRIYNGTTMGSVKQVTLSAGLNVSETPFKKSTTDRANIALVEGDNGVLVERTASGVRREEIYVQQSGVSNVATLNVIGDSALAGAQVALLQKTIKVPGNSLVEPFQDFIVGDFIIYDDGVNLPASNRVRQIAVGVDNDGIDSYSVALNDLILEADIKRAIALNALVGGIDGGTIGTPAVPPTVDTTIPSAPASVSISTATYLETDGQIRGQATVTWAAVTTNTDATAIGDLDRYEVQLLSSSSPLIPPTQWSSSYVIDPSTTVGYFGPLAPASSLTARVRGVDTSGHQGAWTTSSATTVVSDTTPPVAPSTPAVVTQFRGIQVTWNGLDNLGNAMAGDFDHLDLHVSTTNNFTPTTGTKVDSLRTRGGVFSVQGLTYGTTYYAKLIAYDTTGNASTASTQGSATPQTLVSPDVPGLFITNAMIAALAVDDAKIASLSAGKITVGTLVADITVSSRIKTANTGGRTEMNSGGIFGYDTSSNPVFQLTTAGVLTMTGTLTAGAVIGGSASFPDPLANSPGYTQLNSDGVYSTQVGTTNLVTRPSGETTTGMVQSTGTVMTATGAGTSDFALNFDLVGYYGRKSLKMSNTSNANGFVDVPISGTLTAGVTYTYSTHAATTRIDDTSFGAASVYANFTQFGVVEKFSGGGSRYLAQGVDFKVILDGPNAGVYRSGLPGLSANIMGNAGWNLRWGKTFTAPGDVSGTSTYWLRVPAPCTSGGGLESTYAVCYDGMQVEALPFATRYCDGDQTNCVWNGTAHASTSTRSGIVGAWFPSFGEPLINGRLQTPDLRVTNTLKVGSGSPRGTNYIAVLHGSTQAIPTASYTDKLFDTTTSDRASADDGTIYSSNTRFISQAPGMYSMSASIAWASSSTGVRVARWITSGGTITGLEACAPATQGIHGLTVSAMGVLPGNGYYLTVQVLQNTGSNLNTQINAAGAPTSAAFAQIG